MDKEVKTRWLTALLSGKYKQGRGRLRSRDEHFCCLGVLCDVVSPAGWHAPDRPTSDRYTYGREKTGGYLPYEMNEVANIGFDAERKLIEMNDEGKPFPEIAAYIRENL